MFNDIKNEFIGYVYKTINRIIKYFLFIQSIFVGNYNVNIQKDFRKNAAI